MVRVGFDTDDCDRIIGIVESFKHCYDKNFGEEYWRITFSEILHVQSTMGREYLYYQDDHTWSCDLERVMTREEVTAWLL